MECHGTYFGCTTIQKWANVKRPVETVHHVSPHLSKALVAVKFGSEQLRQVPLVRALPVPNPQLLSWCADSCVDVENV